MDETIPRFTITDTARTLLSTDLAGKALFVSVAVKNGAFSYDLEAVEAAPHDGVVVCADPAVVLGYAGRRYLHGATLDAGIDGLVLRNPNRAPIGGDGLESDDAVSLRIQVLLTDQINPELASHGGSVSLLGHRDRVAYVSMHGGCMGCSMADSTMSAGVERLIIAAVPDIAEVRDVTDHSTGTAPWA